MDYAWEYDAPGDGVYVPAMLKELGDRADDKTHHRLRRRPAPDVGGAALRLPSSRAAPDQRRLRGDGIRPAGGDRRAARRSRCRVICVTGDGSIMMNIQETGDAQPLQDRR